MLEKLEFVYGQTVGRQVYERVNALIQKYAQLKNHRPAQDPANRVTERDTMLITYGDQLQGGAGSHLQTLQLFLTKYLKPVLTSVHILPFYPYSSDDGFSVIDYHAVDPALGTWQNIENLHQNFRLMFDGVINHISQHSAWFQGFLADDPTYRDYFIVTDPSLDLSSVTRPRALPLLTRFQTAAGEKYVWTTFSDDQIDLNYRNPDVLLAILDLLLFYVEKGADFIRLDAIGYMWKEVGTTSIHLPQAHALVQVMRAVLDEVAPDTILITETNVPHKDNISYFGDGTNEAQLVYQFPLVPLVLHGLQTGNANYLTEWAATLETPSPTTTFFNFLASHDGIGVMPAKGILPEAEIAAMVERVLAHGGRVSYKDNSDGTTSPYELNITYFDALSDPNNQNESEDTKINRFMVSQAIMLALQGMPGIYFHSLFGSHNYQEGVAQTGRARSINRQKLDVASLEHELADPNSHAAKIFGRYTALLAKRTHEAAFHPNSPQEILRLDPRLLALRRTAPDGSQLFAIHNLANATVNFGLPASGTLTDLISGQQFSPNATIEPYGVLWLKI